MQRLKPEKKITELITLFYISRGLEKDDRKIDILQGYK